MLDPERFCIRTGADASADRAGLNERDRLATSAVDRKHAAVRPHKIERPAKATRAKLIVEPANVRVDVRSHERVRGDRRRTFVFVPLVRKFDAVRYKHAGQGRTQGFRRLPFVRRIRIGMKKTNGNRVDAESAQFGRERLYFGGIERHDDVAARIDAFVQLEAPRARDQGFVALEIEIERIRPVAPGDLEHVAEALRCDQRRARAVALDERVDHERRAVVDEFDVGRFEFHFCEALENAGSEVAVGRRALRVYDPVGRSVERHEIGERTADIDGHDVGQTSLPSQPPGTATVRIQYRFVF